MASQIVAFFGTKMDNSRRGKTVDSRRDKKHISHYSTRMISLEEEHSNWGQRDLDRFPLLQNHILEMYCTATLENGF